MMRKTDYPKLPEHLQPMYDEMHAEFKSGEGFVNDQGERFKTMGEALEHNKRALNFVKSFAGYGGRTQKQRLVDALKNKKVNEEVPTESPNLNINLNDELKSIRNSLNQRQDFYKGISGFNVDAGLFRNPHRVIPKPKQRTSTGLPYLLGVDDAEEI